jgi:hypothetical protein
MPATTESKIYALSNPVQGASALAIAEAAEDAGRTLAMHPQTAMAIARALGVMEVTAPELAKLTAVQKREFVAGVIVRLSRRLDVPIEASIAYPAGVVAAVA